MKLLKTIPMSLAASLLSILFIPAIAYGAFHYIYPADPDAVYTQHGNLNMEWKKFAESDNFTEYLAKEQHVDSDALTAEILVLRNYKKPQSTLYEHEMVNYSSVILRQGINCRTNTVSVEDMMMFSKPLSKGKLVKDLYDLDWDIGSAKPGSIDYMKVSSLCGFTS